MNTRYFVLFALLLATINCTNNCAIAKLGFNTDPSLASDCYQDKSMAETKCCFVTMEIGGEFAKSCYAVTDILGIDAVKAYLQSAHGEASTVTCSAASISISMMLFALFLF